MIASSVNSNSSNSVLLGTWSKYFQADEFELEPKQAQRDAEEKHLLNTIQT